MNFLYSKNAIALLIAYFSTTIAHGASFEQPADDFDDDFDAEIISYDEQNGTPSFNNSSQEMDHKKFQDGCWPFENKGWTASAAFLYWKIDQSLLDFAFAKDFPVYQANSNPDSCPLDGLAGDEKRATFDWQPGFRLDLGYEFNASKWILNGEYTWYHSSHANSAKTPKNKGEQTCNLGTFPFSFLVQTMAGFLNFTPDEAQSKIDFHYNVANLTFQKRITVGTHFNLIPYFGIQGAWIEEDWKVKYMSGFVSTFANELNVKYDCDFKGGGIIVGFASEYCLGMGFSFYGDITFASMYGPYHASHTAKSKPALHETFEKISP